ncbi:hypothetical protein MMC28_000035 [Mycoblastus sanguinarius]|nr:hypothetical protein [Mycoblastus sanguinarius]
MISSTLLTLSLVALSAAQTSTVSLFIPDADPQSLVASIAGSDATATTYVVQCASGAAASSNTPTPTLTADSCSGTFCDNGGDSGSPSCGFPSPFTVVQGPSTVHYALTLDDSTASVDCALMGSTQAVCTGSATGAILTQQTQSAVQTATLTGTDVSYLPVVITAGSVTAKATGASTTGSATKGSSGSSKSGSTSGSTSTSASSKSGSSTSATSQSTGGAMQVGAGVGGVVGALGVAFAGAML